DLIGASEPAERAPIGRLMRDVAALEHDAAGIGSQLAGEMMQQRGLAGAVRADDGVQFAMRHLQRQTISGDEAAKALGETGDRKHQALRRSHATSWPYKPCFNVSTTATMNRPSNAIQ